MAGLAVVTVAAGGLPVVESAAGLPVDEALNGFGLAVTKVVGRPGLPVTYGIGAGPDITAPVITSSSAISVNENTLLSFPLLANEAVTWSIVGGADAARFEVPAATLRWAGNGTKDFEMPNDADANNVYVVQIRATDPAGNSTNLTLSVTVLNVDETAPTITSSTTASVNENTQLAFTLTANEPVIWSIVGGADAARFEISGATLRWLSNATQNFEAPVDADANNIYVVTVRATDLAGNTTDQTINMTVLDVVDTDVTAPTITSATTANNTEGTLLAFALTANEAVTWSIVGGADAARFEVSGSTLRWAGNASKDYETPNDADANNIYLVTVRATDLAGNHTDGNVSVTVLDITDTGTVTRNIKTDYGATGDWQLVTDAVTLDSSVASGGRTLTTATAHFVAGDAGKYIAIEGADNTLGGNWLNTHLTTIATYVSPTRVTLTDPPTVFHAGVTARVEWGHDDRPAFEAYFYEMRPNKTDHVVLTIPAGRYCATTFMVGQHSNYFFFGVKTLTVAGQAPVVFSDCLGRRGWALGGGWPDNSTYAYIEDVAAGATSIVLKDIADASKVVVNAWTWISGINLQGYGDPPNMYFVDYVYITGISGTTVTIQDPLQYSYKEAWPGVENGYQGGPAMLHATVMMSIDWADFMQWDSDHDYQNISVDSVYSVFNCSGRIVRLSGGTAQPSGPNISGNQAFYLTDYAVPEGWEVDKNTDIAVFDNVNFHRMFFQSPCMNLLEVNNSTSDAGFNGTPKKLVVNNSTIEHISLGPYAYGVCEEVVVTDSVITTNFGPSGLYYWSLAYASSGFLSIVDGLITIDRTVFGHGTITWAVPGSWHGWLGSGTHFCPPIFQVLDVWSNADESRLYVQTSLDITGLPVLRDVFGNTSVATAINQHPCPKLTMTNVTGCPNAVSASDFPPGLPWGSRFRRTYTSGPWQYTEPRPHPIPVLGEIITVTVEVTKAYSGTAPALNFVALLSGIVPDNSAGSFKYLNIDARTVGTRVITATTVTGSAGADVIAALGPWWVWSETTDIYFDVDISTEPSSVWPSITLTVETDQGITVAAPAPTFATYDNPGPGVTLSNGDRTAAFATDPAFHSGARSTSAKSTGKYYFETLCTTITANDYVGVIRDTGTFANVVTAQSNCSVVAGTGLIYSNDAAQSSWVGGGIAGGDVLCCAIDLDTRKVWFRRNGNAWNIAGTGTQDPATNSGGLPVGAGSFEPVTTFYWTSTANVTLNCGQAAYAFTKPTGFDDWPAATLREAAKAEIAEELAKTIVKGALIKPLPGEPPPEK